MNTRESFTQRERDAMPDVSGECRPSDERYGDFGLQGHTAGGGTAINWTSIFEVPDRIAEVWWQRFGLEGLDQGSMKPHYTAVRERLSVQEWPLDYVNANNNVLKKGCDALGWEFGPMNRNVKGCMNTGYCGLGCPVDAKQSGFVTVLPEAMSQGMRLYTNVHARFELKGGVIDSVVAQVMPARHTVLQVPNLPFTQRCL